MIDPAPHCDTDPGCITCGDVAVALTVEEIVGHDARCVDESGQIEVVALDFVTAGPGDRVLVHAGVALEKLPSEPEDR